MAKGRSQKLRRAPGELPGDVGRGGHQAVGAQQHLHRGLEEGHPGKPATGSLPGEPAPAPPGCPCRRRRSPAGGARRGTLQAGRRARERVLTPHQHHQPVLPWCRPRIWSGTRSGDGGDQIQLGLPELRQQVLVPQAVLQRRPGRPPLGPRRYRAGCAGPRSRRKRAGTPARSARGQTPAPRRAAPGHRGNRQAGPPAPRPLGVSSQRCPSRTSSSSPNSLRSWVSCLLMEGWLRCSSSAARLMLRVSSSTLRVGRRLRFALCTGITSGGAGRIGSSS